MSVVVHVAGPCLSVAGVRRQRCVWCGALLQEYDLANISRPLEPGEDPENPAPWEPAEWKVGAHVAVDGGAAWTIEQEPLDPEHPGSWRIPEASCMALDPAITK